ncbi:MAG: hypothetical protein ACRDXE_01635 [Acidimicrobiales bacterium]
MDLAERDDLPRQLPPEPEVHRTMKVFDVSVKPQTLIDFAMRFTRMERDVDGRWVPIPDAEPEIVEFRAIKDEQAGGTLALSTMVRWDSQNNRQYDMAAMLAFFNAVLIEGDYERLIAMIQRKDLSIHFEQIGEVFTWLTEQITGRPTRQSSGSVNGSQRTGRTSTGMRSSREPI